MLSTTPADNGLCSACVGDPNDEVLGGGGTPI